MFPAVEAADFSEGEVGDAVRDSAWLSPQTERSTSGRECERTGWRLWLWIIGAQCYGRLTSRLDLASVEDGLAFWVNE